MVGKFNILVVDDEPDKRNLLVTAFEMAGYNVHTARDGVEGLAAVEAQQPDLIVLDVMMPRMDGYEMARQVRSNSRTRFIPIIIQTATRHEAQDLRRGAEVGALGFITDPTDIDLLLARARTLLDFKSYLDTVEEAAFTDHLTGLANRRRFERQLTREISRTRRYNRPFCLLLIDIDRFKQVNDTHGHAVGDEALRRLAEVLQAGTRGIDTAARVGGEEFAVILPETDMHSGGEVAERLRQAISEMEVPEAGQITASIGIAEFPDSTPNGDDLYDAADTALYEAKNQGRNRVVLAGQNGESHSDDDAESDTANRSLTHTGAA
ncbi:MAG: diguanylate cyclase [Pyrinomonadaceae bacterium MAG19_C2-C3]|nr:diguanylate cyclase [Pyrinomonadaceae bacterium MAG19_C2-C3]